MKLPRLLFVIWLSSALALCAPVPLAAHAKKPSKPHSSHSRHHRARRPSWKRHGQQHIDSGRARDIQEALIRDNYMEGSPSGVWDSRTKTAMTRYQSDHGWQTKMLPDSRALIALGLGPRNTNLLNPDTAVESAAPAAAVADENARQPK